MLDPTILVLEDAAHNVVVAYLIRSCLCACDGNESCTCRPRAITDDGRPLCAADDTTYVDANTGRRYTVRRLMPGGTRGYVTARSAR